jgi:hypothetical protein
LSHDPRSSVRPGDPLRVSAEQLNWINRQMRGGSQRAGALRLPSGSPYTSLPCKNVTASAVPRWGVLAISGLEITPSGTTGPATSQFESVPVLRGDTPATTTGDQFVIAVEPIAAGAIGRVAVDGVVQTKLEVRNAAHQSAGPKGSTTELVTGSPGAAVLWRESGTGAGKWALVRIGAGAGSGVRLGTIAATWTKGATATVTQQAGDGTALSPATTFTATNYFATVTVPSGTRRVACALIDSTWVLIAAECA